MQVGGTAEFGGGFSEPSADLIHAGIDAHEVRTRQMHMIAVAVHCPVNIVTVEVDGIVGRIIHIAITIGVEDIVCAVAGLVDAVGREARAGEGKRAVGNPSGEPLVFMIGVLGHIPLSAVVVRPAYIGSVGERRACGDRCGFMVGRRAVVSDGVVVLGERIGIFRAREFVPLVIRQPVLVTVDRDHDDAGFAGATHARLFLAVGDEGVAPYTEVILSGDIAYGMVEAEGDIAAEVPQGNHDLIGSADGLLDLVEHNLVGVAILIDGQFLDELSGSGAKLIDFGYPWRESDLLLPDHDVEGVIDRVVEVVNMQAAMVGAGIGCAENKVALGGIE